MKLIIAIAFSIFLAPIVVAQRDTTNPRVITVTGSFKPVYRPFSKILFNAQPLAVDSTRPYLKYTVPTQNLFFVYQPVPLKPLALQIDPESRLQNGAYVKLGFGNFASPFLQAGATIGDGKYSIFNLYGGFQSIKGKEYLQAGKSGYVGLHGTVVTEKNIELFGSARIDIAGNNRFGFDSSKFNYVRKDVNHDIFLGQASFGIKNANPTEWGISYSPTLQILTGSNNFKNNETRAVIKAPIEKRFGDNVSFKVTGYADVASIKTRASTGRKGNNLAYVLPELIIKNKTFYLAGGVIPAWDNSTFYFSPNILAEAKLGDNKFLFTAGWVTDYQKGSLIDWWKFNSWINDTTKVFNTRTQEYFIGLKGTQGNHVTYSAKAGYSTLQNAPLFASNSFDGKTFYVLRETKMNRINIHGEVGYTVNERFNFDAKIDINQYGRLTDNNKAYGLLPLELQANMHWNVTKGFNVDAGVFFFGGAQNRDFAGLINRGKSGADINLGTNFKINKSFSIWLQGNNLLNTKYARWNNYNTVGLQVMAGIIYNKNLLFK
jgi:hypothetical protein